MRRHISAGLAGAVIVIAGAAGSQAYAQADDQARVDAAIAAFEQRMTDAGWSGSPVDDDEDDEADEEDGDDADVTMGDDEFTECFGELAAVIEGSPDPDEFPGQTALSESMEFSYAPPGGDVTSTTEEFTFDMELEETVAAIAVSVDEANTELLDTFVDTMGAKDTGECMREAMTESLETDTSADEIPIEFDVRVDNEADLGIGDRSARMAFGVSTSFFGMPMVFDVEMFMATVDRDLVMLMHATGGAEAASGFDPLAELEALADSLQG
jgi:hypothetical protein